MEDVSPLAKFLNLEHLSLLGNPICTKRNYRLYTIHKIPSLKRLDFQRVKLRERKAAKKMFKGVKKSAATEQRNGDQNQAKKPQTFVPGEPVPKKTAASAMGLSKEEADRIKKAIAQAKTLEEVERLQAQLKSGQVPGSTPLAQQNASENNE